MHLSYLDFNEQQRSIAHRTVAEWQFAMKCTETLRESCTHPQSRSMRRSVEEFESRWLEMSKARADEELIAAAT